MKHYCAITKVKTIGYHMVIPVLSIIMAGCPLAEPEALRPLVLTKTDKYANKTANKPGTSTCRIKTDAAFGKYTYDAQGRLAQYLRNNEIITFNYNQDGYLVDQVKHNVNGSSSKSMIKYYYQNGILTTVESYSIGNEQGNGVMTFKASFQSGKLVKLLDYTFNGLEREISFKTDGEGRVTEIITGAYQGSTRIINYYEYDTSGNVIKVRDNAPSNGKMDVFRYDNKPNPSYLVTKFKGHPEARIIYYLDNFFGSPVISYYQQPNNVVYSSTTLWNFSTNMPFESIYTKDFIYNSAGYPEKFNSTDTFGNPYVFTFSEYDNCN